MHGPVLRQPTGVVNVADAIGRVLDLARVAAEALEAIAAVRSVDNIHVDIAIFCKNI